MSSYNAETPATYNAPTPNTPGNVASYNTSNAASYNAAIPAQSGGAASVMGVNLPGGPGGSSASPISPTVIDRSAYPDSSVYPVTVPSGASVTVEVE